MRIQKEIDNIREETNWLHLDATTISKYERDLVQGYHNFIEYIDSPKVRTKLEAEITRKEIQKLLRGEIEMDDSLEIQLLQAKLDEKSYRRNKIEFVD